MVFIEVRENIENILCDFIIEYLEIDYRIEFLNINIFGKRNEKRFRLNGVKFIY